MDLREGSDAESFASVCTLIFTCGWKSSAGPCWHGLARCGGWHGLARGESGGGRGARAARPTAARPIASRPIQRGTDSEWQWAKVTEVSAARVAAATGAEVKVAGARAAVRYSDGVERSVAAIGVAAMVVVEKSVAAIGVAAMVVVERAVAAIGVTMTEGAARGKPRDLNSDVND
eukprot:scaffold95749_cov36-Phaeocystis_antarctica.AAC.1